MPILNTKLLHTPYAKFVADWIKEYWDIYSKNVGRDITDIFDSKKGLMQDGEVVESISTFLTSLSASYAENEFSNLAYHIAESGNYIRTIHLEDFQNKLDMKIKAGKLDEAEAIVTDFKRTGVANSDGVSLLNDIDVFENAFKEESQVALFTLQGALGTVSGGFYRGDLSANLSTSKAGKSWYLAHIAESGMASGCRVLYINLEMRDIEMYQRFWRGLTWSPMEDSTIDFPSFSPELKVGEQIDEFTKYRVVSTPIKKRGVVFENKDDIRAKLKMKYGGGDIVFMSLPSYTTTINDIEAIIDNLEYYNNYNVDVLVIDYADLLGSREHDFRHRLNDIWMNMRRVAQQRNIHVATVSQANANGLDGAEITLQALAEDKRKKDHCALMLGMWATDEDKQAGHVTVKRLVGRYRPETYDSAIVLQQLDLGRFYVDSRLSTQVLS